MAPLPATEIEMLLRLRRAEAEALIAECEPIICHYASIEAQMASAEQMANADSFNERRQYEHS